MLNVLLNSVRRFWLGTKTSLVSHPYQERQHQQHSRPYTWVKGSAQHQQRQQQQVTIQNAHRAEEIAHHIHTYIYHESPPPRSCTQYTKAHFYQRKCAVARPEKNPSKWEGKQFLRTNTGYALWSVRIVTFLVLGLIYGIFFVKRHHTPPRGSVFMFDPVWLLAGVCAVW